MNVQDVGRSIVVGGRRVRILTRSGSSGRGGGSETWIGGPRLVDVLGWDPHPRVSAPSCPTSTLSTKAWSAWLIATSTQRSRSPGSSPP